MVVKKLHRGVKCNDWNVIKNQFDEVVTSDYIGYFLFGFIPLYMKKIDEHREWRYGEDNDIFKFRTNIYEEWRDKI